MSLVNWANLSTKNKVLIGTLPPLILLLILSTLSLVTIDKIVKSAERVNTSADILNDADAIMAAALDMETGMRGYLLAGNEEFLAPYNRGKEEAFDEIVGLQDDLSANPQQMERLNRIESALTSWDTEVAQPMIALRRQIGHARTMTDLSRLIAEAREYQYFERIREKLDIMIGREMARLEEREAKFNNLLRAPKVDSNAAKRTLNTVTYTYQAMGDIKRLFSFAIDMQTGVRGYLLSGRPNFLAPYTEGKENFERQLVELGYKLKVSPDQIASLEEVKSIMAEWHVAVAQPMLALREEIGDAKTMDDIRDLVAEARGVAYYTEVRQLMADLETDEQAFMDIRQAENSKIQNWTFTLVIGGTLIAVVISGVAGFFVGRGIASPIVNMTGAMRTLANGDHSIDVPGLKRGDEVGKMASAVQIFKDNMIKAAEIEAEQATTRAEREQSAKRVEELTRDFDSQVAAILTSVTDGVDRLQDTANLMRSNAEQTSNKSATVASAAENASANVSIVASASDQMASSIQEISERVTQSTTITTSAVAEVVDTNGKVQDLAEAANKIGEVVALITDIADQTNLLALNATIEAARAGDAGKGFAVVASEVKNLAAQTAQATEDISSQIRSIQNATGDAVTAIESIGRTINQTNEIAASIASAVEEQGMATREISNNAVQAADGTREVTDNISMVHMAADDTGEAAGKVLTAAHDLGDQSSQLKSLIESFLTDVKAA